MNRFLLHIAYLGTQFRGAQKQITRSKPDALDLHSVQGVLEIACKTLKPLNKPVVFLSSRTDTGVHALHSTGHVDLETKSGKPYDAQYVLQQMNSYFFRNQIDVRVLNVQTVSSEFHARYNAIRRTYLYRIAIPKISVRDSQAQLYHPIEQIRSCYYLRDPNFNIEAVREVASYFVGQHDFRSFMKTPAVEKVEKITRRNIQQFEVVPGIDFQIQNISQFPPYSILNPTQFEYWNFVISARSFLYRQIRRTVGVLIAVGQNRITPRDVKFMIQIPSKESWIPAASTAPAHGLYLAKVEYDPTDLL